MPTPSSLSATSSPPPPPKQTLAQARAEATAARQHLAAVAGCLREGLLLVDANRRVVLANDQFCTLLGMPLPSSQWLGLHTSQLTAIMQPLMADPEAYAAALAQGQAEYIPSTLLELRDGRVLERDARPTTLGDTSGWLLSYRDVTNQHLAESERDAQRKFYETILDEVPVEIAVLDEQRRYVYVNPQAVPDPEHRAWLPGRTLAEYCARYGFPLELAEHRDRMFEKAETTREPVGWVDRTPVAGGEEHHQRQFKLLSGAGKGLPYMLASGLDVTARVQAEERSQRSEAERREQQEFMEQVLNTSPSPVYVRNAAGEVVFGNRALFKLDEQAALFAPTEQVRRAKEREAAEYAAIDAQVLATGREVVAEERSTAPTGEERWFYTIKRPLVRPDGTVQVLGEHRHYRPKGGPASGGRSGQGPRKLPGQYEPRNPHSHERGAWHGRPAGQNPPQPAAAGVCAHYSQLGHSLAGGTERRARRVENSFGQAGNGGGSVSPARFYAAGSGHAHAAGAGKRLGVWLQALCYR
jgi:PAS domain-containing protein